jgi:RNA recognition motif-containing protein
MMTDDNDRKVFIKNIPYEIDEDALSVWCSTFGPITKCVVKRDRFGNSRGFAFVTFASVEGHDNICKNNFFDIFLKF